MTFKGLATPAVHATSTMPMANASCLANVIKLLTARPCSEWRTAVYFYKEALEQHL